MSDPLWEKGWTAARSARLLHEYGDANGAADRAYFAMFHCARAVLSQARSDLARIKRHATVIRLFGRYLVKDGVLDPKFGRAISLAFDLRTIADYEPMSVDARDAKAIVDEADRFLQGVSAYVQQTSGLP
jgi:uncharacterized protein (UPF0332 family)